VACNTLPPLIQLSLHLNFRIQFSKTKAKVHLLIVEYLELTKLKFKKSKMLLILFVCFEETLIPHSTVNLSSQL